MFVKLFNKTIRSLFDPKLITLFLISVGVTLITLISFLMFSIWLLNHTEMVSWHWLDWIIDLVGSLGAGIFAWFLFPILVPAIGSLFLEKTAHIVESQSYQVQDTKQRYTLWQELLFGLRFLVLSLFFNLICLPIYFIPGLNIVVYYLLNGYLLGIEFFETVAKRQINIRDVKAVRKQYLGSILLIGLFLVFIANTPLLNLTAPFVACVMFVHFIYTKIDLKSYARAS